MTDTDNRCRLVLIVPEGEDLAARKDMLEGALKGVDTVVHLAADTGTGQSMYEIERYYRVNVQGTALLFASDAGKHITGQWLAVDGGVSVVTGG